MNMVIKNNDPIRQLNIFKNIFDEHKNILDRIDLIVNNRVIFSFKSSKNKIHINLKNNLLNNINNHLIFLKNYIKHLNENSVTKINLSKKILVLEVLKSKFKETHKHKYIYQNYECLSFKRH